MSDSPNGTPQQTAAGIPVETDPGYQVIYSNFFKYRISPNDVSITFSTISDVRGGTGAPTISDRVQIILPYGQVKSLMEYLSLIVSAYEREVAHINTPGHGLPNDAEIHAMIARLKALGTH